MLSPVSGSSAGGATNQCKQPPVDSVILEVDAASGVTYRTMVPADVAEVTPVIGDAFYEGEPTAGKGNGSREDMVRFISMFTPTLAEQGLTVLACDTKSGSILGGSLNSDYCTPDPEGLESWTETTTQGDWTPCLTSIAEMEAFFNEKYNIAEKPEDRPPGKVFHLWMFGVLSQARGKGVGKKLCVHTVALAKARGFELVITECTGSISTHLMTTHTGAVVEKFHDYATWSGCPEAEKWFRQLPARGHLGGSLTVNHLSVKEGTE